MYKVYLAGPIGGLSYDDAFAGWRQKAEKLFEDCVEIQTYNPMRFKEVLRGELKLDGKDYEGDPLVTPQGIFTRDMHDVMSCDAMLINFRDSQKVSIGTCVEIGWATAFRKPFVMVTDDINPHQGPFMKACTPFVTSDLEVGVSMIKRLLLSR